MSKILFLLFVLSIHVNGFAQEELKWKKEIQQLQKQKHDFKNTSLETVVLTGSSSARFWKSADDDLPTFNVINNGFGGSQMHELAFFLEELVLHYQPSRVIIYEGDNDISAGKTAEEIMETTEGVVTRIKEVLPEAQIYFISPKPSLARWNLADQYVDLNQKLEDYCYETEGVNFIDVWYPMLNEEGKPIEDIFISDGLHMNEKGYEIWTEAVRKALLE